MIERTEKKAALAEPSYWDLATTAHSSKPGWARTQSKDGTQPGGAGVHVRGRAGAELRPAPPAVPTRGRPHPPDPQAWVPSGPCGGAIRASGAGLSALFGTMTPGQSVLPGRTYLPWACWGPGGWQTPRPRTPTAAAPGRLSDLGEGVGKDCYHLHRYSWALVRVCVSGSNR